MQIARRPEQVSKAVLSILTTVETTSKRTCLRFDRERQQFSVIISTPTGTTISVPGPKRGIPALQSEDIRFVNRGRQRERSDGAREKLLSSNRDIFAVFERDGAEAVGIEQT
jgi:hypothetical protein